ncbi:MAG: polysaccharide export protein [Nitrospirae bacterium]|nr:polysaccharide export protein [Nitrospirota bacterium]
MTCLLSLALGLFLFVCASSAASLFESGQADQSVQGSTPNPGYKLGVNDIIRVQVFGEEGLTTETRISGEGRIVLPFIGALNTQGLTVKETEELIMVRLADGYFKNPRVSVYITRYRSVFVSGEVKKPGAYPYEEGLTVLKAATMAGGFTDKASTGRIKIKRQKDKEEETLSVILQDPVFPDDIVVVPQSFF